ncbi:hypothetical protein [Bacillus sp. 165]|uniref:hypothetical protein n=1 Tax=Bacillus sp. 165 TaxID=1529117 RepID=UPI001ADB960E|nr:hypothetical protein [Bacillus sp. 165]MBO9128089.1 hypothetical protein [Bacillus sp. 165]
MSYSNSDGYGMCKECFKQERFCTCKNNTHVKKSEHNPQCQTIGEQEQQQHQNQDGPEQKQGEQIQIPIQEGQKQGSQIEEQEQNQGDQTQGNQTQGPQTQGQIENQEQLQVQDQTEDQDQTQGDQFQQQSHGDQTMENNQTISTPVDVDGVNVNVKCGDCEPTIIFLEDFFERQKKKKHDNQGGDDVEKGCCKEKNCVKGCDCCVQNLADLLRSVKNFQATLTTPADKAIDIYFSIMNGLTNPTTGQVINQVEGCSVIRFRPADQLTVAPNTAVQLCDVAGICATDTGNTPNVFEFLLEQANADDETDENSCKRKKESCTCPCCALGIGEQLQCTANFGLLLDVFIQGQMMALPFYVLAVKDCLAYFVDNITDPNEICVFSLCKISGFTVVSQTIGTP